MLEYDLILPSSAKVPSLSHLLKQKGELRDLLATWNESVEKVKGTKDSTFPTLLVHLCDSYYSSQSLSLKVLRDDDHRRAKYLKDLCCEIDMGLYIADLKRTRTGCCDSCYPIRQGGCHRHRIDTDEEDDITLTKIVKLDGKTVAGDVGLSLEEHFVESEPFDDDYPDDEDLDEDYGGVEQYYRRTVRSAPRLPLSQADVLQVLVMIPSIAKVDWLPQEREGNQSNKRKRGVEVIDLE